MNFLVISLAGIGDTLFSTPVIGELRENFPDAVIDALVLWPGARDLLERNPHVSTVFQKDFFKQHKLETLRFLWALRRRRYDVSINTHPQSRIHYLAVARLINARIRISHCYHRSPAVDRWFVNRSLPQDYSKHSVENNLALLPLLGVTPRQPPRDCELFLSPAESASAEEFLTRHELKARRRFGIHVGSGGTKNLALRRWPLEHYLTLIQRVTENHPEVAILLFGGPQEEQDHARILAQAPPRQVYVVRTENIRQTAALLRTCDLFLSVDSSLMHLAAAVKVPNQFVLETPTFNKPNEPYQQRFTVLRNPHVAGRNLEFYLYDGRDIRGTREEIRRSMASITVDSVYEKLRNCLVASEQLA
ncbi:MAG: glycosyltransferase family 9 protein [Verrucomicrobia bacterium]|nr:glycosyltransferase family 9 protein [Verrucomicrobiota bacterium]